jgi:hypothetical protein
MQGLKRLRKDSVFWVEMAKGVPPRLKPTLVLALCGG